MVTTAVHRVTGGLRRGQMAAVALPSRRAEAKVGNTAGDQSNTVEEMTCAKHILRLLNVPYSRNNARPAVAFVICNNI